MKMNVTKALCYLVLILSSFSVFAEDEAGKEPDMLMIHSEPGISMEEGEVMPLPPPGGIGVIPGTFAFIATELESGDKTVKDAPFSAQTSTEKIQTLSDGNRIVRQNNGTLYRDGSGRVRKEQQLGSLGMWVAEKDPPQTTMIQDPVAGLTFILDPQEEVARKLPRPAFKKMKVPGDKTGTFEKEVHFPPFAYAFNNKFEQKTESIGTQVIEGINAEGTRTITTIPAGEIGNERPIEIISEKWYSPELRINILTKNSDPRFGETTYRVTNIRRGEPDASLFQVPSSYKLEEGPQMHRFVEKKIIKKD